MAGAQTPVCFSGLSHPGAALSEADWHLYPGNPAITLAQSMRIADRNVFGAVVPG